MNEHLRKRRAGILLHITSLPGEGENGTLGAEAFNFIHFLLDTGVTVWQTLPLGVPHGDGSPYQCMSAHAGNPALIDLSDLEQKGWLQPSQRSFDGWHDHQLMTLAYQGFLELADDDARQAFNRFCDDNTFWLDDFALFYALHNEFNQQSWNTWPEPLKQRHPRALAAAQKRLQAMLDVIKFEQFIFFSQWKALKQCANEHGILLFGDIPIFVAYDSADVWANRAAFKLNEEGDMVVVAGVPPDYFSELGQRWGNPHYAWDYHVKTAFKWWLERIQTQNELFDILRIDHFRGLESAWEIPAREDTAVNGQWVEASGDQLLRAISQNYPDLALVAEDLGIITDAVEKLRDDFELPGMKILQFAFGNGAGNPYLPHNCVPNSVIYTGTHDNDTTLGWFNSLSDAEKHCIYEYLGFSQTTMPYTLIGTALASVSSLAVIPMQDLLCLGSDHRMNTPGTIEGNWRWRFSWDQLTDEYAGRLKHLIGLFGRNL